MEQLSFKHRLAALGAVLALTPLALLIGGCGGGGGSLQNCCSSSSTSSGGSQMGAGPQIYGISPNDSITSGTNFTLYGVHFTGATGVTFNGVPATNIVVANDGTITGTAPSGTVGTTVDVRVTTPSGTSPVVFPDRYDYGAHTAPQVGNVSPITGPSVGGTTVTIVGSGFVTGTTVSFGGTAGTGVTIVDSSHITVVTPAHLAGPFDITVNNGNGTSTVNAADQFTFVAAAPTLTTVAPNSGPTAGGTSVTLTGTGFLGATGVTFGGVAATSVVVNSDTSITVTTPAGAGGAVNVVVTTPAGSATKASGYTYSAIQTPAITDLNPNPYGTGGITLTITGTHLTGATAVDFGGTPGTNVVVVSDTEVTVTIPNISSDVQVTVTTPGGTSNALTLSFAT